MLWALWYDGWHVGRSTDFGGVLCCLRPVCVFGVVERTWHVASLQGRTADPSTSRLCRFAQDDTSWGLGLGLGTGG